MDREQLREAVTNMRQTAEGLVQRHAAIYARDVPMYDVEAICRALGDISVDEAIAALDRLQREAAVEGQP